MEVLQYSVFYCILNPFKNFLCKHHLLWNTIVTYFRIPSISNKKPSISIKIPSISTLDFDGNTRYFDSEILKY